PFSELNKLGFGELSTNYWDTLLKNKDKRNFSIPLDSNHSLFEGKQISGTDSNNELWDAIIRRSRIQLYCYQNNDSNAYHLQRYSNFRSYLES
ncbi:hypothetical protein OFN55_31610, partial [Escherichia coli]|nr:hypothetical protein [Escherichia coli]